MKNLLPQHLQIGVSCANTFGKAALAAGLISLALAGSATAQTAGRAVWSMKRSNQDSVALRSAGLVGSPATLKSYVVSNGVPPASGTATTAYSATRGQALAPAADGSGWTAANGGPGTFPVRTFYEQFVVTASASTRLDSLLFTSVAVGSAGGRVALQYSRSGFVSDSANFSGGKGPAYAAFTSGSTSFPASNGGVLPATADGSFPAAGAVSTSSAILPQFATATGNNGTFRFGLNGASGVVLAAGQSLTVRLYFAINSSATNRYVLLKDVTLFGRAGTLTTTAARSATPLAAWPNPVQNRLDVAHPAAPQGARVAVYSVTGQRLAEVAARPGTERTNLELSQLPGGIYLVEYADARQRITTKLVKE